MDLNNSFKISTAKEITMLAIQHNLISKYDSEEKTAEAVCEFFRTVFKNLDIADK